MLAYALSAVIPLLLVATVAGVGAVLTVAAVWLVVTVLAVLMLVTVAYHSLESIGWLTPRLWRRVTAGLLLLSGLLALLLPHPPLA